MKQALAALLFAGAAAPALAGLTINLHDIGGVTGSPAEQGFRIAAKYWESVLSNNATLNFDVGFAPLGTGILGGTNSSLATYVPIDAYYAALAATGTSALDAQTVANLSPLSATGSVSVLVPAYKTPATTDGVAKIGKRTAPDNTAISSTIALSTANAKALLGGTTGTDGTIQFSSTFAFDFNPTDGISAGKYDFIGVAVHEMGHALGFLSAADDFNYSVGGGYQPDDYWWGYGLDMFRYSAPGVLDWSFNTNSYFSIDGGQTAYQNGFFSTGADYGDGWQASHWKQPVGGTCTNFLGIMNPYICGGKGDQVTGLDLALFDAIGWNLNVDVTSNPSYAYTTAQMYQAAVPEPTSWALLLAGAGMMMVVSRRRQRRSGGAA
ncbi:MAG: NF038122 family metalloprotease [Pseudomonadota bacterium]|nr:NF038122 family metalloprotease [Pseudomonadota bacterium]